MAIEVEDGSGKSNAESYIDLAYLSAYAAKRGLDITGITEANIIKAMDYFESAYLFKGTKLKETQALAFPRLINGVVEYPVRIKSAICELTIKSKSAELLADSERLTTSEKVGEIEVHYSEYSKDEVNYNFVINLIMPWLLGSGISGSLVRTY